MNSCKALSITTSIIIAVTIAIIVIMSTRIPIEYRVVNFCILTLLIMFFMFSVVFSFVPNEIVVECMVEIN